MSEFNVTWKPSGRGKAQCPPNPEYPDGIALDCSDKGKPSCVATLPYPAAECGLWIVECKTCGIRIAATAAGRVDDPRSIRISCALGLQRL